MIYIRKFNEQQNRLTPQQVFDIVMYFTEPGNNYTDNFGEYYSGGGCYDFAAGLGSFIESHGGRVEYWLYGSNSNPAVHAAIRYENRAFDVSLANQLENIPIDFEQGIEGDEQWYQVPKRNIPYDSDNAKDLQQDFEEIYNTLFSEEQ